MRGLDFSFVMCPTLVPLWFHVKINFGLSCIWFASRYSSTPYAKLFFIRPQQQSGDCERCDGPADRASGRIHGCDLTAIQTIQRKTTRPMSAMKETPRE